MKKLLIVIFGMLLFFGGCEEKENMGQIEKTKKNIKIGILLPLTGEGAFWGQNAKKGIEIAISEIEKQNNQFKYKYIWEDSNTNSKQAVSAFQKMLATDNIKYSIVDMISSNVLAIAPIAEKNKVIVISPGASSPKITNAGDYIFRNWPSDSLQGKDNAMIAKKMKWKNIAILKVNNDYGLGLSKAFKNNLDKDIKIVIEETYTQGEKEFKTILQKIKESNPDGIYLLAYPQEIPIILKQSHELNFKTVFLGTETFENKKIIEQAGEGAEGIIYTFPKAPDVNEAKVKIFREKYRARYNEDIGTPADVAYDALHLIVQAIEANTNNVNEVKKFLYNTRNYNGASGEFSIDENGDAIKSFDLKTVKNGNFILLQK